MKFGLESEKFIFDLKNAEPSQGVFRFLDALSDFEKDSVNFSSDFQVTNEFVLSMVEIGTRPSHSPMEVLKDYLLNYLLIKSVALREQVALVPLASLPMDYLPHMTPRWAYFVQNSILAGKKQESWMMEAQSPLRAAGNCAGIHIHAEIETPPEYLFSNRELQDKFNMGLMLTPLIAFGSSPYFFGAHEASSMRGARYYNGVYNRLPLHGALPPVMKSSVEALEYTQRSIHAWIEHGLKVGFSKEDMKAITAKKGANWNPVRWNRQWNTIEIRCLDSDSIDMDASKFIWISSAMGRLDLKGEGLQCRPISSAKKVDKVMLRDCFEVSGKRVSTLGTDGIREIFNRAIVKGTRDPLVEQYLHSMKNFAIGGMEDEYKWVFRILIRVLDSHLTTSSNLLAKTRYKKSVTEAESIKLVRSSIKQQDKVIEAIKRQVPEIFLMLEEIEKKI